MRLIGLSSIPNNTCDFKSNIRAGIQILENICFLLTFFLFVFNIFVNMIIEFSKSFQTPLKHEQYFASIGNRPRGVK